MKYKVYRNLNNGKLSIKDCNTGLVVGHADAVDLYLADFKVSRKGVERIRQRKRKAVIATVDGGISWMDGFVSYKGRDVQQCSQHVPSGSWVNVAFNPYQYTDFVENQTEKPLKSAEVVAIDNTGRMLAWAVTHK